MADRLTKAVVESRIAEAWASLGAKDDCYLPDAAPADVGEWDWPPDDRLFETEADALVAAARAFRETAEDAVRTETWRAVFYAFGALQVQIFERGVRVDIAPNGDRELADFGHATSAIHSFEDLFRGVVYGCDRQEALDDLSAIKSRIDAAFSAVMDECRFLDDPR